MKDGSLGNEPEMKVAEETKGGFEESVTEEVERIKGSTNSKSGRKGKTKDRAFELEEAENVDQDDFFSKD